MALQGTLDTFALPDVLRLLAATKKTGRLRITSARGEGRLWVDAGSLSAIVASYAPQAVEPVDALFELLRIEEGSFTFEPDATPDGAAPAHDVEELLEAAGAQLDEWRDIVADVPSLGAWVTLRAALETPEVTLGQDHWTTLVAVGAGATVSEIGDRLGQAELPVSRAVRRLVQLGVVDVLPTPPARPASVGPGEEPVPPAPTSPPPSDEPSRAEGDQAERFEPERFEPERFEPERFEPERFEPERFEPALEAAGSGEGDLTDDPDAPLPTAGPIRARRARGSARPTSNPFAEPERFVPLELPGQGAGSYGPIESSSEEADVDLDHLASAFPGLAPQGVASPEAGEDEDEDEAELARQMAALPPEVAQAVRAAAEAATDEERDAALEGIEDDEAAPISRGLLLKFLSSVRG